MAKKPDEILAERILSRLQADKLLSEKEVAKLFKFYSAGKLSLDDWVLSLESSSKKEEDNVTAN